MSQPLTLDHLEGKDTVLLQGYHLITKNMPWVMVNILIDYFKIGQAMG